MDISGTRAVARRGCPLQLHTRVNTAIDAATAYAVSTSIVAVQITTFDGLPGSKRIEVITSQPLSFPLSRLLGLRDFLWLTSVLSLEKKIYHETYNHSPNLPV